MIIAIDFDGTLVEHEFPDIGTEVPGAFYWLKEFQNAGAKLILWTIRDDGRALRGIAPVPSEITPHDGNAYLTDAVGFCRVRGIEFWDINHNSEQVSWSGSPKAYAHIYIDDAAYGCPLVSVRHRPTCADWTVTRNGVIKLTEGCDCGVDKRRPYVDWSAVGPAVMKLILTNSTLARPKSDKSV